MTYIGHGPVRKAQGRNKKEILILTGSPSGGQWWNWLCNHRTGLESAAHVMQG